jgi:hypothetical protein
MWAGRWLFTVKVYRRVYEGASLPTTHPAAETLTHSGPNIGTA